MEKEMEKEKVYYDVVLDAQVPCQIRYRVLAASPEDALEEIKRTAPASVKPIVPQKINKKAQVYLAGSSIIQLIKRWA